MKRLVVRVGTAKRPVTAPGTIVRKGQYLGSSAHNVRAAVSSPADAVVEDVHFIAEQQAYILVLCPLGVRHAVGAAAS